jgi:hypothetical protein
MEDVKRVNRIGYVSFGWSGENREIEIFLKDGTWMTRHFVDGKPDPLFTKCYGSHELRSPWTEDTDRDTVIEELSARNQHATFK